MHEMNNLKTNTKCFIKKIKWSVLLRYIMVSVIEVYNFSFCENYTKHMKTFCGQNVESFNVEASVTYSYQM